MLEAHGATEAATVITADVVLLAADSVLDLATELAILGPATSKTIVLGDLGAISPTRCREPGTLEVVLETYRPLGVFQWPQGMDLAGRTPGFLGLKDLADKLNDSYVKAYSTDNYGAWVFREGEDAGDFVLRVLCALERPQTTPEAQQHTA